jgi:hypothetical protein
MANAAPVRYAIQKARGKGWKTLEVGEDLARTEGRFRQMVGVNPRAYFRLIRLEPLPGGSNTEMEFTWKLIELHDPNAGGAKAGSRTPPARRPARPVRARQRYARERVRVPIRFYAAVVLLGLLIGAAAYLRYGMAPG